MLLERVKPTEPAILEMVRNHYSYRDNVEKRPRTEKTSKTWWSNARLVVFSDPERTLVFAWQWPKLGMRADGQEGFNNTLFHRSDRCAYLASDIVLAAEKAVVQHWGGNRAYTYVDPVKIKSSNPGFCYKIAGWKQIGISKTGKPLLEKVLTDGIDMIPKGALTVNFKLVLKTYSQLRQLTDDETALLNTLRGMSDTERELFAETLGPPAKVKAKPKTTRKIEHCGICDYTRRAAHHKDTNHKDYHEFHSRTERPEKSKRAESLAGVIAGVASGNSKPDLCTYELDGKVCKGLAEDGVHDESLGYLNYHPFESRSRAASADTSSSSKNGSPEKSEVSSKVETESV